MPRQQSLGNIYRKPGRAVWMMKYYQHGRPVYKTTGTDDERKARAALAAATTDTSRGIPTDAAIGKLTFDTAAADLLTDYANNNYDSEADAEGRIRNHLTPFFGGMKLTAIRTPHINAYITRRRLQHAKNGTINRELALLKRMFTLAQRAALIVFRPHVPKLDEHNVRKGFFEADAFAAVCRHLPEVLADVATMGYITGWRVDSEIVPLEWRQIDLGPGGWITLDPDTTKNDEPRVFPITAELRAILERRQARRQAMRDLGHVCSRVFFREVAAGRRGLSKAHKAYATIAVEPKPIKRFEKMWGAAATAAGYPGRIRHDLRRTAVRNMNRRGVPDTVAMKLTGHKTRSVYDRYNIVDAADLRGAQARLEDQLPGER